MYIPQCPQISPFHLVISDVAPTRLYVYLSDLVLPLIFHRNTLLVHECRHSGFRYNIFWLNMWYPPRCPGANSTRGSGVVLLKIVGLYSQEICDVGQWRGGRRLLQPIINNLAPKTFRSCPSRTNFSAQSGHTMTKYGVRFEPDPLPIKDIFAPKPFVSRKWGPRGGVGRSNSGEAVLSGISLPKSTEQSTQNRRRTRRGLTSSVFVEGVRGEYFNLRGKNVSKKSIKKLPKTFYGAFGAGSLWCCCFLPTAAHRPCGPKKTTTVSHSK